MFRLAFAAIAAEVLMAQLTPARSVRESFETAQGREHAVVHLTAILRAGRVFSRSGNGDVEQ